MKLSEKILALRRARGLSQERLAEQLQVSRQAVSRWENGSALPDASNVFQLSKLFGVSADYLLDDRYGEEVSQMTLGTLQEGTEPPRSGPAGSKQRWSRTRTVSGCLIAFGALSNFLIYLVSRMVEVDIPYVTYAADGTKWHHLPGYPGHSYWYFIQEYSLELLAVAGWCLLVVGLAAFFLEKPVKKRFQK